MRIFYRLTVLFPLWILLTGVLAFIYPPALTWFKGPLITFGLGMIMLGMGLTLTFNDFKRILRFPTWIIFGVILQYTVMPLLGYALGYLFRLPTPLAVGLVLVACCPGGTASNVMTFLAKANVALSVSMTALSTCLAIVMTPLLTAWLAGSRVDVHAWGLFLSVLQVVILPIIIGILMNQYFPKVSHKVAAISPFTAVVFICLIVGSILGQGKSDIIDAGPTLIFSIITLHVAGFILGYFFSSVMTRNESVSRTTAIEVGMQNSGLGVVLARQNFANPLIAIPSAISSITHCLVGSCFAAFWSERADVKSS